jgi:hypothetical protein
MKSITQVTIAIQFFILLVLVPLTAIGENQPMKFSTTEQVSQQFLQLHCNSPFTRIIALKNSEGLIGGYVLQPTIIDNPISYYDCNGKYLTTFHIFDSDDKRTAATNIVTQLTQQFPVQEGLDCSKQKDTGK